MVVLMIRIFWFWRGVEGPGGGAANVLPQGSPINPGQIAFTQRRGWSRIDKILTMADERPRCARGFSRCVFKISPEESFNPGAGYKNPERGFELGRWRIF